MDFLQQLMGAQHTVPGPNPIPDHQQPPTRPNFYFQATGKPQQPGSENWSIIQNRQPIKMLLSQGIGGMAPHPTTQVPVGWKYSQLPNGNYGWHNPQNQPKILPHYLTPGGLSPQPQWIDPVKKLQLQMQRHIT